MTPDPTMRSSPELTRVELEAEEAAEVLAEAEEMYAPALAPLLRAAIVRFRCRALGSCGSFATSRTN